MKYMNATAFQRFISFIIDIMIIQLLASFILSLIPAYNTHFNLIMDFYRDYLQGIYQEDLDALLSVLQSELTILGLMIAIQLPIFVLYLIVLPYYWEKQTLGRWAMRLKVVTLNETKPTIKNLILRELVGGFVLLQLLASFIVIPILFIYFSVSSGRSLADMIGKTRLVRSTAMNSFDYDETEPEEKREYIDAVFKEESSEESQESEDSDYKVF